MIDSACMEQQLKDLQIYISISEWSIFIQGTNDDEHAVSTVAEGPFSPSK